jgi:L-fuculose-phosphate aldolase
MYEFGYSPCNSGNISARLDDSLYLVTPSGICKGELTPEKIVKMDDQCESVDGFGKASSESKVHVYCYKHRPDVGGVVHSHAPFSVAMSCLNIKLDKYYLPDQVFYLGAIPRCDYHPSGSWALAESIEPYILDHNAFLLGNHGAVTLGKTLEDAYYRMEMLEQYCKVLFITELLGGARELSKDESNQIIEEITSGI